MACGHCVQSVRRALEAVPGADVRDVRVGSAEVTLDASTNREAVLAAVQDAGYEATISSAATAGVAETDGAGCA